MSRTINFRGKRFDNGQWAYGNLIIDDSGNCEIVDYKNNQEIRYDVRRETIGMFTGLYDADGKEIYEGDIFQVKAYEPKFEVYFNAKRYNDKFYHRVRNAVNDLKEKNEKLVLLNAFELVEITHRWSSWNRAMDFAEFMKQLSAKMSIDSIRDSSKIFDLK